METSFYLRCYQISPVPRQSRGFSQDNNDQPSPVYALAHPKSTVAANAYRRGGDDCVGQRF
jgi:hypothetical protein